MPFRPFAMIACSSGIFFFCSVSPASIGIASLTCGETWRRRNATDEQSLQQFLSLKPFVAPLRVALLANAERMTEQAQNCVLKTLEEPPSNTVLLLTTAYPDHLLPTCLSRCQLISLSPVARPAMVEFISARQTNDAEAEALVGLAHGRPGWAVRAMSDRDWVVRMDRWAEQLAALAFE